MSKQAKPPPPGDKAAPSAPPPPPTWRNWIWPIMLIAIFALWFFLPTRSASTSLSYTQFLQDVQKHEVKTVQLATTPGGTTTGDADGREELHRSHPAVVRPGAADPAATTKGWRSLAPPRPTASALRC